MAYIAPYIDETGLHIPSYQDIVDDMVEGAKAIFGEDIYLGNDSADYQLISTFALKQYDTLQAIQYAYNSRSPATASGAALDAVVKLNGIKRKAAGYSTCDVKITGTPYTQISNGGITDKNKILWDLPKSVVIPTSGTVVVTATCSVAGGISVAVGDLSEIATPTYGWVSVTNEGIATLGVPQETDEELRIRQTKSVAIPSQTLLEGTLGSIMAVPNVKRAAVYENDTNSASVSAGNPYGLPAHSITCVVDGGESELIAAAILYHKGVGCYTNGDIEVELETPNYTNVVRFSRPTDVTVEVAITLIPYHGFATSIEDEIKRAVADYLNSLGIGRDVSLSMLISVAMRCNADLNSPTFGISTLTINDASADLSIDYDEIPVGDIDEITVEVDE